MIQATIFSGHSGRLRFDKSIYLTFFGGCELVCPTAARHVLAERQTRRDLKEFNEQPVMSRLLESDQRPRLRRPFFLTIFGGTDIKAPTLAAEFIDLRETLDSGLLTLEEWDRAVADLSRSDWSVASLTLFGGFDECKLPSEEEEIESLALQRHLGNISASATEILQYGIGQRDVERRSTIRRAIQTAA